MLDLLLVLCYLGIEMVDLTLILFILRLQFLHLLLHFSTEMLYIPLELYHFLVGLKKLVHVVLGLNLNVL